MSCLWLATRKGLKNTEQLRQAKFMTVCIVIFGEIQTSLSNSFEYFWQEKSLQTMGMSA